MEFKMVSETDSFLERAANLRQLNLLLPTVTTIKMVTDFAKELEFNDDDVSSLLEEEGGLEKLVKYLADTAEVAVINFFMRQK